MLRDIAKTFPSADRGLRWVGLQRIGHPQGGLYVLSGFAFGLVIGAGVVLLLRVISEREPYKPVPPDSDGLKEALPAT